MAQCCICLEESSEKSEFTKCRSCNSYFCEKCVPAFAFQHGVCADCQETALLENDRHFVKRSERIW